MAPKAGKAEAARFLGLPMKWVALVALTFQTSWQVFVIKFARRSGGPYLNSTVVFVAEILKTLLSIGMLASSEGSLVAAIRMLQHQFVGDPLGTLRFAVPGLAYTIMNNLVFLSLDKLNAAVQQVTYQLKILAAAVLAVVMLGKVITIREWSSLFLLVVGVALVQWPRDVEGHLFMPLLDADESSASALSTDAVIGLAAVVTAAFTGGFAGVYMEMVLKQVGASLWLRNAQLGLYGSITALLGAYIADGDQIRRGGGLFQGFSWQTGAPIFALATGGLLVAVVIKYADNLLRQFSTALSIILTSLVSALVLQEFTPDAVFAVGASSAIAATFMYNFDLPSISRITRPASP